MHTQPRRGLEYEIRTSPTTSKTSSSEATWRGRIRVHVRLLAAITAGMLAWAVPAAQANVGSFEGGDGDQTATSCATALDWQCLLPSQYVAAVDASAPTDDVFASGNKDNQPDSWLIGPGTVGTPKADLKAAWSYSSFDPTTGTNYLDLAFNRASGGGDSYVAFELNQSSAKYTNSAGTAIVCRTNGDVAVSFDISPSSAVSVNIYKWMWDAGVTPCTTGATGSFSSPVTLAGGAEQALNGAPIVNYLSTDAVGTSFTTGTFGEAAVNLSALANAISPSATCEFFNDMQVSTRSSASITSSMEDFVDAGNLAARACQTGGGSGGAGGSGGGGGGGGGACTTSAPTVQINSPADNSTVNSTRVVLAGSSDQQEVEVLDGTTVVGNAPVVGGSWTLGVNGIANGSHAYSAVVTNTGGCSTTSNTVHTTVTGSGGGSTGGAGSTGGSGATGGSGSIGGSGSGRRTGAQLRPACVSRKLVLTDVLVRGRRVVLYGAAVASLIGHKVKIVFDDRKTVAFATVRRNGLFSTTAPLPPRRMRNSARYRAAWARLRSANLKLTRRLVLALPTRSAGKIKLVGQVMPPLAKPAAVILVQVQVSCHRMITIARAKPSKSGRFTITVPAPSNQPTAVYRLATKVRKTSPNRKPLAIFSLPEAVTLR